MGDSTVRDAISRSITARLLVCDEAEIRALDRVLTSIERRRDMLDMLRDNGLVIEPGDHDGAAMLEREYAEALELLRARTHERSQLRILDGGRKD